MRSAIIDRGSRMGTQYRVTLTKAGKKIYVILDNPHFINWPACNASVVKRPVGIPDFLASKNYKLCSEKQSERKDKEMLANWNKVAHEEASSYKNIHFIDLTNVFCHDGVCSMLDNKGNILYRDSDHLNIKGSVYAAPFIMNELRK